MLCKSKWLSVLAGRHKRHHAILVSVFPVTLWWLELHSDTIYFVFLTLINFTQHFAQKNEEAPAVIDHRTIARADQLPNNGVSRLHLIRQHSRELTVCMCHSTSTVGKDSQKSTLVLQVPLLRNCELTSVTGKRFKCCRKDIFVLAIKSLQQLKSTPLLGCLSKQTQGNAWF